MKTKKVSRHYCDFCGKGMFRRPSMEKHEAHCTQNPNRKCGMCNILQEVQRPISELIQFIKEEVPDSDVANYKTRWDKYEKFCNGCPACMLAGIIQSKVDAYDFNFKEKCKDFWREQQQLQREQDEWEETHY